VATAIAAVSVLIAPRVASAGFFDFLFNNQVNPAHTPQASAYADPSGGSTQPLPPIGLAEGGGGGQYAHCVRMCDGRYFPILARSGTSPTQVCQSFCPASATRVFFGSSIDGATAANGERYADLPNAYTYRKKLSGDCTCNGRGPTGLAPIDVSLDTPLRPGDIVATANGLVAYSGGRVALGEPADFTPVADYAGLTAGVRAKLSEMKISPVSADVAEQRPLLTGSIDRVSIRPGRRAAAH